ncbi:MAG: phage tail protein, partial [Phocaeicola sp.]|nr:phage tail protein [Phocaeicola sp.]
PYYRHGRITEQTLGEETTYVVTWSSWYRVSTTEYVQAELQDYLPLSGGTLTGVVNGVTPTAGDNSKKLATTEFVNATAQQANWNVTDTTSKAFIKNKPGNLINIGNNQKFDLVVLKKDDNSGYPVYLLMHELVQYNPDQPTLPIRAVYGFNGMVFGIPRVGNDGSQFLAIVKVGLGYEYNTLYSSSTHYSPVVLKDETNNKYYWAMKIKGSYQLVYMLGAFTANPLNTGISAVDLAGTLPEGWRLVHTARPYPFDNASVASADKDGQGNNIASTYLPAVVGAVVAFAGSTTPQGWLLCDGSAVSRTDYAALYAVIGTTYGAGNGSTTFNLPNLIDKFVEGSVTAGTVKSAGLPNITGSINDEYGGFGDFNDATGAFYLGRIDKKRFTRTADNNKASSSVYLDASRSSNIYGNSTTVQPPALTLRYIIKY